MRRATVLLLVAAISPLSEFIAVLRAQSSCAACQPLRRGDFGQHLGDVDVCLEETPDANSGIWDHANELIEGFNYWQSALDVPGSNNSVNFRISYGRSDMGECDAPDVDVVVRAEDLPFGTGAIASPDYRIAISQNRLLDQTLNGNDWRHTGAHEMGHVMGWSNVDSASCQGQTIMYAVHDDSPPQSPTACGDAVAVADAFIGGNTQDGGLAYEPSNDHEDCWDVYRVTYFFYQTSNGDWVDGGSRSVYLGWTCGPPEI